MHSDTKHDSPPSASVVQNPSIGPFIAHIASRLEKGIMLMTCQLLIKTTKGASAEGHGILDSMSSASFVSEHLASDNEFASIEL